MTEFWRFGATPVPLTKAGERALEFEQMGWDGIAVGDGLGLHPDPFVFLALAGAATTTLQLGTAVCVPNRNPMLAANSVMAVDAVSEGRTRFSFGRGDGAMAAMGIRPMSVDRFGEYIDKVNRYLRREDVDVDGTPTTLAFVGKVDPALDRPKPAVDVSATGRRMIELAARHADSVTFGVGADLNRLRSCVELAHEACERIGRDPATFKLGCYLSTSVVVGGDREAARDLVRGAVFVFASFSTSEGEVSGDVAEEDRASVAATIEHHRPTRGPKHLDFSHAKALDPEFVDRFAVIGDAQECADRLDAVRALGFDRLVMNTRVASTDLNDDNARRIAHEVFPLLR